MKDESEIDDHHRNGESNRNPSSSGAEARDAGRWMNGGWHASHCAPEVAQRAMSRAQVDAVLHRTHDILSGISRRAFERVTKRQSRGNRSRECATSAVRVVGCNAWPCDLNHARSIYQQVNNRRVR